MFTKHSWRLKMAESQKDILLLSLNKFQLRILKSLFLGTVILGFVFEDATKLKKVFSQINLIFICKLRLWRLKVANLKYFLIWSHPWKKICTKITPQQISVSAQRKCFILRIWQNWKKDFLRFKHLYLNREGTDEQVLTRSFASLNSEKMSLFSWPKTTFPLQLLRLCSSFIQDFSRSFKIFQDYSRSFKNLSHTSTKTLVKNNFFQSEHFHLLNIQVTWTHFKTSCTHWFIDFCCTLVKLFCKNQFDFFALVKSPLFFLQMITLETSALFFPQMLIPGGSIFATGEAQGVPTGSILLYHTMVRGTLGMFTKQSFLTHCGCQCWWPTSCFLSHSFSCNRRPNPTTEGAARGCCSLP